MSDTREHLFDDDNFVVSCHLWFVGPADNPPTIELLVPRLLRVEGTSRSCIVGFTDSDLALQFVDVLKRARPTTPQLRPIGFVIVDELRRFLQSLEKLGETHIGIDPGLKSVRMVSIAKIVSAID